MSDPRVEWLVQQTGHARYRELARLYPERIGQWVEIWTRSAAPPVQSGRRPAPGELDRTAARLALSETCPYRGEQVQGGCACLHRCHARRGQNPYHPDQVSRQDCERCLRAVIAEPPALSEVEGETAIQ